MEEKDVKLANLLFGDVGITVEECLCAYPKRVLPSNAEVTRIAPSPTGYLHIGQVYSALISKLLAYHTNGVFYMRLEDTDNKREIKNTGDIAYEILTFFGLKPDEGFCGSQKQVGDYGDYIQSKRKNIYLAFAKRLVELGKAYPCFCSKSKGKDDVLKRREEQLKENFDIELKDVCRDLTIEEIEKKIKAKTPFALRFKSFGDPEKSFVFVDKIKGEREIRENAKDIIVLKSDKIPPYSFAHVVDDTLMQTTTVVRGEEWYPSLASHLDLFKALGLKAPSYAHTPVVSKLDETGNKRKLSKRKDKEADARFFIEAGYPVSGVMEYLLNLINSDFEDWRKKNPNLSYFEFPFDVSKIGTSNPMFDFVKLDDCSKQAISMFTPQEIYEKVLTWAQTYAKKFFEILKTKKDFFISLFSIDRVNAKNVRKDIAKWSDVYPLYSYMFEDFKSKTLKDFDFDQKIKKEDIKEILKSYKNVYSQNDDKQVWFDKIKSICPKLNFCENMKEYKQNPQNFKGNIADVSGIIRVAVTTKRNTPDLYELLKLLGESEVKSRLNFVDNLL